MDGFFNDNLKPFVDTTQKPWRWQAADNTKLSLSAGHARAVPERRPDPRCVFTSGSQILVKFQLVPETLDPQIGQITLDIAGQTLTYNHGHEMDPVQWPKDGKTLVRVTITPACGRQGDGDREGRALGALRPCWTRPSSCERRTR